MSSSVHHPFNKKMYSDYLMGGAEHAESRAMTFYFDEEDTESLYLKNDVKRFGFACFVSEISVYYPKVDILGRLT